MDNGELRFCKSDEERDRLLAEERKTLFGEDYVPGPCRPIIPPGMEQAVQITRDLQLKNPEITPAFRNWLQRTLGRGG